MWQRIDFNDGVDVGIVGIEFLGLRGEVACLGDFSPLTPSSSS